MGTGLAQTLSLRGHAVTVVDSDPEAFDRLGPGFPGQTIAGTAFDQGILLQAGIQRGDGLAAITGSDETNVVIARIAHQVFRVPRVVARLHDPRKAEIYRRLGLQTVSPISWGVNRVAELLCYSPLDVISSLGYSAVDIVEAEIPHLLAGRAVNELTIPGQIQVVAISRGNRTFMPTLGTLFQEGDLVHLAVLAASIDRLKVLLGLA